MKDLIFIENLRFFGLSPQNDNVESYFVINLTAEKSAVFLYTKIYITNIYEYINFNMRCNMDDLIYNQRFWPDRGNVMRAEDAVIENISMDNRTGFVTISYRDTNDYCMNEQVVVLAVDRDTVIRDAFGNPMSFRDLRQGMTVDAEFSAMMTRSMPPQSRAYRITVVNRMEETNVTEGMVLDVDLNNRFLYTGNPYDIYSQIRFVITDSTVIRDRRGRQIRLRDLRIGDFVRVIHATFMTMSIPPQTTAFEVQVL